MSPASASGAHFVRNHYERACTLKHPVTTRDGAADCIAIKLIRMRNYFVTPLD